LIFGKLVCLLSQRGIFYLDKEVHRAFSFGLFLSIVEHIPIISFIKLILWRVFLGLLIRADLASFSNVRYIFINFISLRPSFHQS